MAKCPICHVDVKARAENAAFPFCSPRCRTIDLGKWLDEEYRVPTVDEDGELGGGGAAPSDDASRSKGDVRN